MKFFEKGKTNEIVEKYSSFLFDCDGVLWNFDKLLPGVSDTLSYLRGLGKNVFFVTNNSTKSRKQYAEAFKKYNIQVKEEEIYCSGYLAAQYIKENYSDVKKAYVIGEVGIHEELNNVGINSSGLDDSDKKMDQTLFKNIEEKEVGEYQAVVVGWDRGFNFYKLCYASLCLQLNKDCKFIATNNDSCDKVTEKRFIPVGGSMVSSIEKGTGIKAYIAGKPSPYAIQLIEKDHKVDRKGMLFIGDRLDTDILIAKNSNISSLLVLTGVTSESDLKSSEIIPDYVLATMSDLLN